MIEQLNLFPVRKAKEARDRALKRVANNNQGWLASALDFCENTPSLRSLKEFTGEELRIVIAPHVGHPRSPHAWGLVARYLMERGVIVPTGKWIHMRTEKSHSRKTPSYSWAK